MSIFAGYQTRQEFAMARRLRFGFVLFVFLFTGSLLIAQSNDTIDSILSEEPATAGSAAYVALTAGDLLSEDASRERAVQVAAETGWLPEGTDAERPVTFGELAYMLMEALEVQGGLMYRLLPGPRYAGREFVYQGWSPERRGPNEQVSGQFLIRVTGNFLDKVEVTR